MSETEASQTEDASEDVSEETDAKLDASMKVDPSSLDGGESDFAKAMGFGGDPPADAPAGEAAPDRDDQEEDDDDLPARTTGVADEAAEEDGSDEPDDALAASSEDEAQTPAEVETAPAAGAADDDDEDEDEDVEDRDAARDAAVGASGEADWEDIQPRSAAEGDQDMLAKRADQVLDRAGGAGSFDTPPPSIASMGVESEALASLQSLLDEAQADLASSHGSIATRDQEIAALRARLGEAEQSPAASEKELEALRVELETIASERDQLIDHLAATSGQLVQSRQAAEKLEASLRAARGALIPLPDGERALRAEVIGLRGRLDEAAQENVRLTAEVASVATELAIATARVEDRQHEIDYHADRASELEREAIEKDEQLQEAITQHRDALALCTRLQAENTELRSTQGALEETIQARDLEIAAREEHLRVTRDGLTARDRQIIDLNEQLLQERHQVEALEADLERAAVDANMLLHKVERRESRIATLTETLARIEEAMGQRLQMPRVEDLINRRRDADDASSALSEPAPVPAPAPVPSKAESHTDFPRVEVGATEPEPASIRATQSSDTPSATDAFAASPGTAAVEAPPTEAAGVAEVERGAEDTEAEPPLRVLAPVPALPPILGRWRDRRFAEIHPDTSEGVAAFLAERLHGHLGDPGPEAIYLKSLGGSLPDAETRLVTALQARGLDGIRMTVLDASESAAAARRQRVELAGLGEVIDIEVGDLDAWNSEAPCHAVLLADALHGQPECETILDTLAPTLARGALLLFVGRIGGGPVQLSASTLMRLEELWDVLPESLANRDGLGQPPYRGDDGGVGTSALDVGTALESRFECIVRAGFGHLADLVVGPARGFMLDDEDEDSSRLLESILAIDESRSTTESLPPRHGVAVFAHGSAGRPEIFGQEWPEQDPTD